jgi:hypothetical protein
VIQDRDSNPEQRVRDNKTQRDSPPFGFPEDQSEDCRHEEACRTTSKHNHKNERLVVRAEMMSIAIATYPGRLVRFDQFE